MKKRVLSMLMALALCLPLLPAPAWAEEADAPEGGAPAADEQPAVQSEPAPQAAEAAVQAATPITRATGTTSTPKPWKHCAKITSSTLASARETNSMPPPPLTPLTALPCTLVPAGT